MSAHILMAKGDVRTEARSLLERLVADNRVTGELPDIDRQGDSTVVVMDPHHEDIIPEFEKLGFLRRRDEDTI
jgi:hypothetical protein